MQKKQVKKAKSSVGATRAKSALISAGSSHTEVTENFWENENVALRSDGNGAVYAYACQPVEVDIGECLGLPPNSSGYFTGVTAKVSVTPVRDEYPKGIRVVLIALPASLQTALQVFGYDQTRDATNQETHEGNPVTMHQHRALQVGTILMDKSISEPELKHGSLEAVWSQKQIGPIPYVGSEMKVRLLVLYGTHQSKQVHFKTDLSLEIAWAPASREITPAEAKTFLKIRSIDRTRDRAHAKPLKVNHKKVVCASRVQGAHASSSSKKKKPKKLSKSAKAKLYKKKRVAAAHASSGRRRAQPREPIRYTAPIGYAQSDPRDWGAFDRVYQR